MTRREDGLEQLSNLADSVSASDVDALSASWGGTLALGGMKLIGVGVTVGVEEVEGVGITGVSYSQYNPNLSAGVQWGSKIGLKMGAGGTVGT